MGFVVVAGLLIGALADRWTAGSPHALAMKGDVEALNKLLERSPELVAKEDRDGEQPIHCAATGRQLETLKLLLSKGASARARTRDGGTPLILASCVGAPDVVRALVEAGAPLDEGDARQVTPLHYAVNERQPEVVAHLLQLGARSDVKDEAGRTPLEVARERAIGECEEVLRAHGNT